MKKIVLLLGVLFIFSCSKNDESNYEYKLLPIKEAITPTSFQYRSVDTITVKYSLPNGCHFYHSVFFLHNGNERTIAIRAVNDLGVNCTQATIEKETKIPIWVTQREDYLFKFWKGNDANGDATYEERIVEVN